MGNIAFDLPNNDGVFRYAYRDTGGAWSANTLMVGGNKDHLAPFTSPVCDELRITAFYSEVTNYVSAHLAKLSITSGLDFEIKTGDVLSSPDAVGSLSDTAQAIPSLPVRRHDQTISMGGQQASTVQIIITGIAQQKLDIGQIVFCNDQWTPPSPSRNYDNGSALRPSYQYERAQSMGGSIQKLTGKLRGHNVTFRHATDSNYKQLAHLIDYKSVDGLLVYRKDVDSTLTEDSYLAQIMITDSNITEDFLDMNTVSVDIIEAVA